MLQHLHSEIAHYCPSFNPELAWMTGTSDVVIAAVYILIPFRLWGIIRELPKELAPEIGIFGKLLAAFVVACGITHLLKVMNIFANYDFWLFSASFNWIVAIISIIAYVYLVISAETPLMHVAREFREMEQRLKDIAAKSDEQARKLAELEATNG
jgi:hypothetical protein